MASLLLCFRGASERRQSEAIAGAKEQGPGDAVAFLPARANDRPHAGHNGKVVKKNRPALVGGFFIYQSWVFIMEEKRECLPTASTA